jgi:hypothetical protein
MTAAQTKAARRHTIAHYGRWGKAHRKSVSDLIAREKAFAARAAKIKKTSKK